MEQVQHLKEETRNADNRRNTLEADLRRLQGEHTDTRHKLSLADAQLQMIQKVGFVLFPFESNWSIMLLKTECG